MRLHTLGPVGTDSQRAAQYYQTNQEIILHSSFEEILTNLADYQGEEILLPVAFKSQQVPGLNFADFNYLEWQRAKIKTAFVLPLLPLIVLENLNHRKQIAIIHAATEGLMKRYLQSVDLDNVWGPSVVFAPSKPVAFERFVADQDWFSIVSLNQYENSDLVDDDHYQVRQTLRPEMVWVVYEIK
ncbi:hypothetical protein [Convivina intestini]|uniref:Amino acid biosynthesis protein n=1 Tax=Convivina intestini TaxID=1505726 RepID=A0A2U1DES9_9LACO|nr:hypothetical protein [Convivina intestini]PVY86177.1 hypothetical protein C7384_10190 [Convivina intestini]CAH1851394.1 hypothetical protein R077811_00321 [Convivina intestini]CAH1852869.1 hypothetical protein R078131_00558 [Convivina intestini]SDB81268.1 hypothetical protein SAMN05216341_10182 [Leuconostocaceae bacterium R-53105]